MAGPRGTPGAPVFADLRPLDNGHSRRGIGRWVAGVFGDEVWPVSFLREQRAWGPVTLRPGPDGVVLRLPPRPRLRLDPLGAARVQVWLRRHPPRVLHLTDPLQLRAAPPWCRLIVTVYDLELLGQTGRLATQFQRGLAAVRDQPGLVVVTLSDTMAGDLRPVFGPSVRIEVVPPGPTSWPDGPAHPDPVVLVVGALDPHKRPEHALAAARLAHRRILFAGRHAPALLTRLGAAPAEVASDLGDAALAARIRGASCVVHASRAEGFGLPVLEALSLGTPVVAYDLPVTREIVGPDYPLVPEPDGPAGLAQLITQLAEPEHRAAALRCAEPSLARFRWTRSRRLLRELYVDLVGQR